VDIAAPHIIVSFLAKQAKNSSVGLLALLQYGRYTLFKHNNDFFKNTLNHLQTRARQNFGSSLQRCNSQPD